MLEKDFRKKILDWFRGEEHVAEIFPIEGNEGLPDIFIGGTKFNFFIELKFVSSLPEKENANVFSKSKHGFTPMQKAKAKEFNKKGVRCFGLIGVGGENITMYQIEPEMFEKKIEKNKLENCKIFDFKSLRRIK